MSIADHPVFKDLPSVQAHFTARQERARRILDGKGTQDVINIVHAAGVSLHDDIVSITDALWEYAMSLGASEDDATEWAMDWDVAVAL